MENFQVLTAMSFALFAEENVDIAVIEVNHIFHLNYFVSAVVCILLNILSLTSLYPSTEVCIGAYFFSPIKIRAY